MLLLHACVTKLRRHLGGGLRLLGPVFRHDLVRTARRGRPFLLRGAYAGAMLLALAVVYSRWFRAGAESPWQGWAGGALAVGDLAAFANTCFTVFLAVQFLGVFLLTPIYTAGAVAEERERRTLDHLLAT